MRLKLVLSLFILELAHLIFHLYYRLIIAWTSLYYLVLSSIEDAADTTNRSSNSDSNGLRSNCSQDMVIPEGFRIPDHIAMNFTNEAECLDLNSIARILCWCKQLGIEFITLHDDSGKLKARERDLYKFVEFKMKSLGFEKPISRIRGLRITSKSDGRQKFVEAIKSLLKVEPDQITVDSVQKLVGWPVDPELLVNFGAPLCLHGFPPWQLRLTEILSIPMHRNLPRKIFMDCLHKYSRTTQRLGA